jgi:hypothetical protein
MDMVMGGGALTLGLAGLGPEGLGVGEKRVTVVRCATLAGAAMADWSVDFVTDFGNFVLKAKGRKGQSKSTYSIKNIPSYS